MAVRFAASPEVLAAIERHYASDGVPEPAAGHLAAETVAHPETMDTSIERWQQLYQELLQQGYDDAAAQNLAVELLEREGHPGGQGGSDA